MDPKSVTGRCRLTTRYEGPRPAADRGRRVLLMADGLNMAEIWPEK